jgi:hypothetical protein
MGEVVRVIPPIMKQIAVLALATSAVSAHAVIFPSPFFATPAPLRHTFDANTAGAYTNIPVFTGLGTAATLGPGVMAVMTDPSVVSIPHLLVGRGADVQIKVGVPMRRFGGFFNSGFFGLFSGSATFRFFDAANNPIGSATVPMTPAMQWVGFTTFPKWSRVEIGGTIPGIQGIVGMDSLRIRPI